jgi:hypothetical protein
MITIHSNDGWINAYVPNLFPVETKSDIDNAGHIAALNWYSEIWPANIINIRSFAGHEHAYRSTTDRFYWPIGHEEFWQWCNDRHFDRTPWGHFGAEAHRAFADYILDRLHDDFHTQ